MGLGSDGVPSSRRTESKIVQYMVCPRHTRLGNVNSPIQGCPRHMGLGSEIVNTWEALVTWDSQ